MLGSDSPPVHRKYGLRFFALIVVCVFALIAHATPAYALLPSTTTIVSSNNPSSSGGSVTFTATVSGIGLTPTGTVTFMDGSTALGMAAVNSGEANFSTTTLSTGNHSITAVYGGDTLYNGSTSSALAQSVVANSTSTAIVSSANPSALNQSVIFTATVSSGGGTPTGTVTFMDGTTTLGTSTLSGGQAMFATTVLAPGNHSITANYSGDANFSAGSSPVLTQTVNLGTSSTAVTSSANPTSFGQAVTFTATVSGLVLQPTGTVTFMDGGTTLGTGNLNASGQATFTTSALAAGSHSIAAVYGGDGFYNSSTSSPLTQTVNQDASTTAIAASPNPSALGASVTFTATVTGAGVTPTGTVTFKDGGTTLGSGALSNGQATFSTSSLALGSHAITAVYGGDANYSGSTSAVLTQTVSANSSSTAVSSSIDPSTFGQSVTFTATVSGTGGTPTGTVTFKDGAAPLGSGSLNGSGQATFSTSTLATGGHAITASYNGDSNFASSVSPALTQTVNQSASTTTGIASSVNPSSYGTAVTFTATVSGVGGTPTGTVTFKDGGTTLGTGTLSGSGQATLSASSLAVGGHSITAAYGGDANFPGSTSPALTQNVTASLSTTAVSSSLNPSASGQAVTFTATVSGTGGTPTGTVTFRDGGTTLGSASLNGSGQTTLSVSSLAVGGHSITAAYGGDGNFPASTSPVLTQNVAANSSTTAVTSSLNPSASGQAVTFTASVSGSGGTPTGTVTFRDGGTTLGSASLNGSGQTALSVSSLAVGGHSITAAYGGDAGFSASTSPVLTQTVNQGASAVALTSSANPSAFGASVSFTAIVSGLGGTPTGTVTFRDGATTLGTGTLNGGGQTTLAVNALAVGAHPITASYSGDGNFPAATSAVLTQTVAANASTTALASSANPGVFGQSVTFTATVTGSVTGTSIPTGTVTFRDGATTLGTATVTAASVATFTTSTLSAGSHAVTASYGGDSNFASSVSPALSQAINQASSGTSLASSANPSRYGAMVTFTALVSGGGGMPTGTVTFKDGATMLGSAALNGGGQATLSTGTLAAGTHAITASYGGDGNFPASASPALSQAVNQNTAAIALTSSVNPSVLHQAVTFTATVTGAGGTPTGTVTFKDGGTVIGTATLSGAVAAFATASLAAGNHTIVAVYGGDGNFTGVTSAALTQAVDTPADSIKLRQLQVQATQVAAQASGQAIAGTIESAIADGFSDRCTPLVPSATGVHVTFCPQRSNKKLVDGDFAALGAGAPAQDWLVWADVRGAELVTNGSGDSLTGQQVNAFVGVTRRFTPDMLLGAFGGYEFFDYESASLDGRLQGAGWTAGSYLGWRFLPGLRFEAGASYSGVGYQGSAGTASGAFAADRLFVTAAVVGTYKVSKALEIDPSVRVYDLWEQEAGYTDSLGTVQAARTFSTGRASAGAKAIFCWEEFESLTVGPYAGLYADYYFSNDSAFASPQTPALLDGVSARVVSGVTVKSAHGGQFSVGGELGGIAGNFTMWTVRAAATVPF